MPSTSLAIRMSWASLAFPDVLRACHLHFLLPPAAPPSNTCRTDAKKTWKGS